MLFLILGIVPVLILADMLMKNYVEDHYSFGEQHKICNDRVILRKVHNRGMCMNAFEKYPDQVRIVSLVAACFLTIYQLICLVWQRKRYVKNTGLALMLAGAWSNTIDRCLRHHVVDYIGVETKWKHLKRITFNLGDLFIFLGAVFIWLSSFHRKK
ncbi:MAG: signal peptidase II [Hespellia sp.]|nr:signal peptidase II [Hespellia sp.]